MKTLETHNPTDPASPYYSKDFDEMLTQELINPLKELGLKPIGIQSIYSEEVYSGQHILMFQVPDTFELSQVTHITDNEEEGSISIGTHIFDTLTINIYYQI